MGIKSFEISLSTPPNHVYTPGDTVTGTITLHASPDADLKDGKFLNRKFKLICGPF